MNEQLKIGKLITHLREQRHMTQGELAHTLQTSQSAVARMERGEQNFSTEMLLKISDALHREVITLASGALNFQIEGGVRLSGTVRTNVSKNATVALMSAALLNSQRTFLKDVPRIEEINRLIEVFTSIGIKVRWIEDTTLEIVPPKKVNLSGLNEVAFRKTRSAFMLLGPFVHMFSHFILPRPGGCELGARTIEPYIHAFRELGVQVKNTERGYEFTVKKLKPGEIVMYEAGDTATECVLMAAARIPGTTIIKFASANYQVQETCFFLRELGVQIEGIGTSTLVVHGVSSLSKALAYSPSEDPIESMFFLSIAATTNSSIMIERCPIDFLELELLKLKVMGFKYKISKRYKAKNGFTNLVDIQTFPSKLTALKDKIHSLPYPGINIDNLPLFAPIATQAQGETLIHDWTYENRAIYYTELAKLGADVTLLDPHRVFIRGGRKLKPAEIICPPALRPSVMILVAMLAAPGVSVLRNVYPIERGYEDICTRLQKLGAKIKILKGI